MYAKVNEIRTILFTLPEYLPIFLSATIDP